MDAKALLEQGRLADAIQEVNKQVKTRPTETSLRVLLFELLCFEGNLDRADKQLDLMASQAGDPGTGLAVQVYRALVAAEKTRRLVFTGDALPKFVTQPGPHIEQALVLLKKMRSLTTDLASVLGEVEEATPAVAGQRGGQAFSSFRDADDRVAGVIEVFNGSEYIWVPTDQVHRLEVAKPARLRDLMWAKAKIEVGDQPAGDVFIPALYVNSHTRPEEPVKLGRMTEWEALEDSMVVGFGQRMFLVDGEEVALHDLGDVSFAVAATGAQEA
jgi:type VI secretion system protein ImpE